MQMLYYEIERMLFSRVRIKKMREYVRKELGICVKKEETCKKKMQLHKILLSSDNQCPLSIEISPIFILIVTFISGLH